MQYADLWQEIIWIISQAVCDMHFYSSKSDIRTASTKWNYWLTNQSSTHNMWLTNKDEFWVCKWRPLKHSVENVLTLAVEWIHFVKHHQTAQQMHQFVHVTQTTSSTATRGQHGQCPTRGQHSQCPGEHQSTGCTDEQRQKKPTRYHRPTDKTHPQRW